MTDTGRNKSTPPQMQNIPLLTAEESKRARAILPEQCGFPADYASIEERVLRALGVSPEFLQGKQSSYSSEKDKLDRLAAAYGGRRARAI